MREIATFLSFFSIILSLTACGGQINFPNGTASALSDGAGYLDGIPRRAEVGIDPRIIVHRMVTPAYSMPRTS